VREDPADTGGTLADFLAFLWRHRVLIVAVVGIVTAVTIVSVLVVPVEYTAKATVLPQDNQTGGAFSIALAYLGAGSAPFDFGSLAGESVVQEAIIRSRHLADVMNEEFGLAERYGTSTRESRLRRWFSRLETKSNKQGLLVVSYRDRDPEFAARIVSALLEQLDRFNRETRTTTSRRVREFLEARVVEAEARLNALEDTLAAYQAGNKTLALDPSADSAVSLGADLLVRRIQLVTETRMLRQTLGRGAPALTAKEMEIQALDEELARLPELNSELSKLMRSRRVYERTYTFLYAQLEESRIEEARDTPTIDILDPPVPPQEKSWPQRTWTVLLVFGVTCLLSLFLAKGMDSWREVRRRLETDGA
jgi:uncharacterized protein involved in exopolysaccharide biosynthesis